MMTQHYHLTLSQLILFALITTLIPTLIAYVLLGIQDKRNNAQFQVTLNPLRQLYDALDRWTVRHYHEHLERFKNIEDREDSMIATTSTDREYAMKKLYEMQTSIAHIQETIQKQDQILTTLQQDSQTFRQYCESNTTNVAGLLRMNENLGNELNVLRQSKDVASQAIVLDHSTTTPTPIITRSQALFKELGDQKIFSQLSVVGDVYRNWQLASFRDLYDFDTNFRKSVQYHFDEPMSNKIIAALDKIALTSYAFAAHHGQLKELIGAEVDRLCPSAKDVVMKGVELNLAFVQGLNPDHQKDLFTSRLSVRCQNTQTYLLPYKREQIMKLVMNAIEELRLV